MTVPPVFVQITGDASGVVGASNEAAAAVGAMRTRVVANMAEMEASTVHFSHSALIGLGELTRGFGRIGATGQAGAFALRELSGGAARLGAALGPAGGLAGIVVLLGGAFYEMWKKAGDGATKAREKILDELGKLANAGELTKLNQKMKEVFYGTPFDEKGALVKQSKYMVGAFEGSLGDLEAHFDKLNAALPRGAFMASGKVVEEYNKVSKQLDVMREHAADVRKAIENLQSQPATMQGILPMVSSAQSIKGEETEFEQTTKHIAAMNKSLHDELERMDEEFLRRSLSQQVEAGNKYFAEVHAEKMREKEEKEKLQKDFWEFVEKLDNSGAQIREAAAAETAKKLEHYLDNVRRAYDQNFYAILSGTMTLKEGIASVFRDLAVQLLETESWAAVRFIAIQAAKAAAATWAALAGIPFVGPFIAPVAAAAALVGVLALGSNIGGGSSSGGAPSNPSGAGTTPASGSPGNPAPSHTTNIYLSAMDAQSFRDAMMRNAPSVAAAAVAGASAGYRLPTAPGRG